jgi:hypothetical protein
MRPMIFCHLACVVFVAAATGCASGNKQPSPVEEGWTRLGQATASADEDRSVLRAESLPGKYASVCIETDGPVLIERLVVSFGDTTTFQADGQLSFDRPGRRVIQLPGGEHQITYVAMMHSGGKVVVGTRITVWVR